MEARFHNGGGKRSLRLCQFISHSHNFSFSQFQVYIPQFWLFSCNYEFTSGNSDFLSCNYEITSLSSDPFLRILGLHLSVLTFFSEFWVYIAQFWPFSPNFKVTSHNSDLFFLQLRVYFWQFWLLFFFFLQFWDYISQFWPFFSAFWVISQFWHFFSLQLQVYFWQFWLYV